MYEHRCVIYLEEVSTLEIGFNKRWTERRNEVKSDNKGENGEANRYVEARKRWDRVEEWSDDEPSCDGHQAEEQDRRERSWRENHDIVSRENIERDVYSFSITCPMPSALRRRTTPNIGFCGII